MYSGSRYSVGRLQKTGYERIFHKRIGPAIPISLRLATFRRGCVSSFRAERIHEKSIHTRILPHITAT